MSSDHQPDPSVEVALDCSCPVCRANAIHTVAAAVAAGAGDDNPAAATFTCLTAAALQFNDLSAWENACFRVFATVDAMRRSENKRTVH